MSDPTDLIISIAFGTTMVVAVSAVALRTAWRPDPMRPPAIPEGRVPVWFYQPQDLIGPLAVFLLFGLMFASAATSPPAESNQINAAALAANIGFQALIAALVSAHALRRCSLSDWLGLRWKGWPWLLLIGPGSVLLMWGIFLLLDHSGYLKWMQSLGVETVQDTVRLLQESNDPLVLVLMGVTAVVVAPLCEEILFRGYLYPILKKFTGMWPAVFCSSLFFSIAHGNLTVLLPLFILGLLLVWLYEKTGSLWTPIAVHFCFNAATVAIQMAARLSDTPIAQICP